MDFSTFYFFGWDGYCIGNVIVYVDEVLIIRLQQSINHALRTNTNSSNELHEAQFVMCFDHQVLELRLPNLECQGFG